MDILKLVGLLFTFAVITLIDMPKIKVTKNKKKYLTVYYSIIVPGILIGIFEILHLIPDYYNNMALFFKSIS